MEIEQMKKILVRILAVTLGLALILWAVWTIWLAPTRIAFVNYQPIMLGEIDRANENPFIKIKVLEGKHLAEVQAFDMVLINGMGLRIVEEERALLEKAAADGLPILSTMVTNPANQIISIDSIHEARLKGYIHHGGRANYRAMLEYIRREIDGKSFRAGEFTPPIEREYGLLHHPDPEDAERDDLEFHSVAAYRDFLRTHDRLHAEGKNLLLTGVMGDPTDLILALEAAGHNVYAVRNLREFLTQGHADSTDWHAMINLAHGRMGDDVVRFLTRANIPLFSPLNTNMSQAEWEADKQGMLGGFLSQSVVTPEIDGALRPYALFANELTPQGVLHSTTMPSRLEKFVQTIGNYLRLQDTPNSEKRVAIYYFKGPGQSSLSASGLEVVPSLHHFLQTLRDSGYRVEGLPPTPADLEALIQSRGAVLGSYAKGKHEDYLRSSNPVRVDRASYQAWTARALRPELLDEVQATYGDFPGEYMATPEGELALARIELGNVVLLPQYPAAAGDNHFKQVHGAKTPPPHIYIASYLWARYAFEADALIHFGTHGNFEFTPAKQVALSDLDWGDALIGPTPHIYLYTIANVGEGIIAKRRSYAGLQTHLTAPFMPTDLSGQVEDLTHLIEHYAQALDQEDAEAQSKYSLQIKSAAVRLGVHRALELDSNLAIPYGQEEILRIERYADEIANSTVVANLYTLGHPYVEARVRTSVEAMSVDPIAFGLHTIDKARDQVPAHALERAGVFERHYRTPARRAVQQLYAQNADPNRMLTQLTGLSPSQIETAELHYARLTRQHEKASPMQQMLGIKRTKHPGSGSGHKSSTRPDSNGMKASPHGENSKAPEPSDSLKPLSQAEQDLAYGVHDLREALTNVRKYQTQLRESPQVELRSLLNALRGGYTPPSPGGDPIANPNTLPTGRNLFSINAEATPTPKAWEDGVQLAKHTLALYAQRHNDSLPRKVSYTLWSSEFIETEGATIAQVLYMLGVEPIWDAFGRVTDLRLIPSGDLGRPRIDVVVQTSGQLRDLAASRLFLVNRAVSMAANSTDDNFENEVHNGILAAERKLIDLGISPAKARAMSERRVFGGVNGGYGTGIQGMVFQSSDWETRGEIAQTYLHNMGAFYGNQKDWEDHEASALHAALTRTDIVVQPRQSNTWGPLSLDHVFEFMGGLNLAVKEVTGKEPDAYLSDYRNRHRVRMQEVKEAIHIEARTTLLNPAYLREHSQGGASSASLFTELVQNAFGWEVMKPNVIDDQTWDEIYSIYIEDALNLGVHEFFERANPSALQEITAIMLETVRKGMWTASEAKIQRLAELHTRLVAAHAPSCTGFVCDNPKLREYISQHTAQDQAVRYNQAIDKVLQQLPDDGVVLRKETLQQEANYSRTWLNASLVILGVGLLLVLVVVIVRRNRRGREL